MFKLNKKANTCVVSRSSRDMHVSQFRQPSMVDSFLFHKHENPVDGVPSVRCTSDIYMLFNQQRMDRLSREAVLQHFEQMSISHPSLTELKKKLSDDQLISLVKSRYIQQPSELLGWSMYLNSLADEELKAIAQQIKLDDPQKKEPVEDDPLQVVAPAAGAAE